MSLLYTFIISFMKAHINKIVNQAEELDTLELARLIFELQCLLDARPDQSEFIDDDSASIDVSQLINC